jgi:hypothetical protein
MANLKRQNKNIFASVLFHQSKQFSFVPLHVILPQYTTYQHIKPHISCVYFIIFHLFSWYNRDELVLVEGRTVTWAVLVAGSRGWDNYRHQVQVQ